MPVPEANVFPNYDGNRPKWVVIHKTASPGSTTAQEIANFFFHVPDRRSSHYVVGLDGIIVQCVSEADASGANCCLDPNHAPFLPEGININLLTISIEHVDSTVDNSQTMPAAQVAASHALVKGICERNGIPQRAGDANGGIIGHRDLMPENKARCPGPTYDFNALFAYLQSGGSTMSGIPQGWSDSHNILTAPNGHRVVKGFRDHILTSPTWTADDQPLMEEIQCAVVEESNPSLGPGSRQITTKHLLEYTPSRGVFEGYIGQELQFVIADRAKQIAALQAEIATLKQFDPAKAASTLAAITTAISTIEADLAVLKTEV
jgi:hypothetical protein